MHDGMYLVVATLYLLLCLADGFSSSYHKHKYAPSFTMIVTPRMAVTDKPTGVGLPSLDRSDFLTSCGIGALFTFLGGLPAAASSSDNNYFNKLKTPSGQTALVSFQYPKKWTLQEDNRGIIAKSESSSSLGLSNLYIDYLQSPEELLDSVSAASILDRIFDSRGRYSQFGKPDYRAASTKIEQFGGQTYRFIDVRFNALSPTQRTVERRGSVFCTQIGNGDIIILFGSTTAINWKKEGDDIKDAVLTFRAGETKETPKSATVLPTTKKYGNDLDKLEQIRAAKEFYGR